MDADVEAVIRAGRHERADGRLTYHDWQIQHRYMQIEGMAELNTGPADDQLLEVTPRAA